MTDLVFSLARLSVALFLVVLNGFFVAAEFAFVRIREEAVRALEEQGRFGAETLREVVNNLDDYLAVTQLGITIASIGLGWAGEPAIASILEEFLRPAFGEPTLHLISFGIAFSAVTFLHVVFGELAPKTFSIQRTEQIALLVAVPMKGFRTLFTPGIIVFNGTANQFTRLFGVEPAGESSNTLNEKQLLNALSESEREGQVDAEEAEMVERVFELDDLKVREIMVPRPDVTAVSPDDTVSEVKENLIRGNHTRYPVLENDGEDAVGLVDVRDILRLGTDNSQRAIESIMSEIVIIPESATVRRALTEFKEQDTQIAAIIDEWGVFEGIVTVEDTVEVVVGDLRDRYDVREPTIEKVSHGYKADGRVQLKDINQQLHSNFSEDGIDIETIGGFVLSQIGEVPDVGESIERQGYRLTVSKKENSRISKVQISPHEE